MIWAKLRIFFIVLQFGIRYQYYVTHFQDAHHFVKTVLKHIQPQPAQNICSFSLLFKKKINISSNIKIRSPLLHISLCNSVSKLFSSIRLNDTNFYLSTVKSAFKILSNFTLYIGIIFGIFQVKWTEEISNLSSMQWFYA